MFKFIKELSSLMKNLVIYVDNLKFVLSMSVLFVLIFLATGKYDEISSAVAQVDSQDTSILVTKGYALDNLGNSTGAIEYFDRALAIDPNDQDMLVTKGVALDNLGNSNDNEINDGGNNGGGQNNNDDSSVGDENGNDNDEESE